MSNHLLAAAAVGRPGVNLTIFLVFVVITLAIVVRAARRQTDAAVSLVARYFTRLGVAPAARTLAAAAASVTVTTVSVASRQASAERAPTTRPGVRA